MYAIVEIAGQQYKVEKDQQIFVHRLEGDEGSKVEFDRILLTGDGDKITVGAPAVEGMLVSAKILEHLKGDKVIVFKKKRRKGFRKKNGHRQFMTKIQIEAIGNGTLKKAAPKAASKPAAKTEEVKAEKPKTATKKAAPKTEKADDLTKIKGIGPVYKGELEKVGFSTFEQIANLSSKDIEKIADTIDGISEDSIAAEEWVKQAKALIAKKEAKKSTAKKADDSKK